MFLRFQNFTVVHNLSRLKLLDEGCSAMVRDSEMSLLP